MRTRSTIFTSNNMNLSDSHIIVQPYQALVFRQMVSHLIEDYFGIQRSLWST